MLQIQLLSMSQLEIVSEYNQDHLQTAADHYSQLKLPKIKNVHSRASVRSKSNRKKHNTNIPQIQPKHSTNQQKSKQHHINMKKFHSDFNGDEFALDIQEKLKHVLENVNNGDNFEQESQFKSEQQFQEAVQQHRLKIKLQKKQLKQKLHTKVSEEGSTNTSPKHRIARADNRPGAIFKKKARQNTQKLENKYLEKKKELFAALGMPPSNPKRVQRVNSVKREKPKKESKSIGKHQSLKSIPKKKQSTNLFDNIHNLLQNPKQRLVSGNSVLPKKTIQQLEQRIKLINEKLGIVNRESTTRQTDETPIPEITTVRDWRRFEYSRERGPRLNCHNDSNFQMEMEKVGKLQERNHSVLDHYVEQQTLLVELGFLKKIYPRIQHNTQ